MTFTIHASKNGQSVATVRISPAVAVDKARVLEELGWQVHVTDSEAASSIRRTSIGFCYLPARQCSPQVNPNSRP